MTERAHLDHLGSASDLVTTDAETRAGFAELALEKTRLAAPLAAEARLLQDAARRAGSPWDLLEIEAIQSGLLAAAGHSGKAQHHLRPADRTEAIQALIKEHLEPAGDNFVEELVFRFLLTRGDSLDGAMHNVGGALARRKLARAIIAALNIAGVNYRWRAKSAGWIDMSDDDAEIERALQGLTWGVGERTRTLLFDLNVPIVGQGVDVCLFDGAPQPVVTSGYADPRMFLAVGVLQGGIDPAEAGARWETVGAALQRIHTAFEQADHIPPAFFLGAAIEQGMASEIWGQLQSGMLANAANLNRSEHLSAVARWLIGL